MDLTTLVTIVLVIGALGLAAVIFFAEEGIEAVIKWLFRKGGINSSAGPLTTSARIDGDDLVVELSNQGKEKFMLAAFEARDHNSKRRFPIPHRIGDVALNLEDEKSARQSLSKFSLAADSTKHALFHLAEFRAGHIKTLAALDTDGTSWPIDISSLNLAAS